jgi:acyl-CoA synthetase (AMP-forming)/AMP-acid ligase II
MPSWETNCIEDWEKKVLEISKETLKEDMAAIGGIPPWVIMYFEKLLEISSNKTIKQIFPNFSLFVYGGVNYSPYKESFRRLIGEEIDSIEYYPASEGFFAYQDSQKNKGLLLQLNSGIFYEFIEIDEMKKSCPKRLTINEVEKETNYVLVVSTNAGLWGYNTGDTVEFTSLVPARVKVTGRYKHFISAFGEHVIGSEVEKALKETLINKKISLKEFTVAPNVNPKKGLPFHQWWIEFDQEVSQERIKKTEKELDRNLQSLNSYYKDLVQGKVLKPLEIVVVKKGGFKSYMESIGKLGGQNKLPRLSNDRKIADQLINYIA